MSWNHVLEAGGVDSLSKGAGLGVWSQGSAGSPGAPARARSCTTAASRGYPKAPWASPPREEGRAMLPSRLEIESL